MKEKNIKVNSILNVIKTLSSIIFPLITFPYVSRVLQPDNIGKVNFGSSFVSYFTLIATLGITTYAIRECAAVRENKDELGKKASEIFSINICTTVVAYMLLFISLLLFRDLDNYRTLIIIQSTAILFSTLGADWLNSAMEDFAYITARTIAFQFISLILLFLFVKSPDDYMLYAAITVLSSSGANLLNILYRRRYCRVCFTTDMKWAVHFKPIVLLFVMILAQTIFSSADVTMLGLMKGDYEVGIYSTATKISSIIAQVVSSLAWVVMPRMSAYFAEGDYEKINGLLKKVFGVLVLIGLPCIAGSIALANEIVLIVGGVNFQASAYPLQIAMITFAFSLLGGSFLGNMVLLPSKREKIYMYICCFATVVNVIMNYFLIQYFGAIAAAGTTAFCSFIMMVLMLITRDKRIKLDYIWRSMSAPIVGSLLIIIFCYLVSQVCSQLFIKTIVSITGSVFIYLLVMVMMKNESFFDFYKAVLLKIRKEKDRG